MSGLPPRGPSTIIEVEASDMLMRKRLTEPAGGRTRRWGAAGLVGLVAAVGGAAWLVRDRGRAEAEGRAVREALAARRFAGARSTLEKWIAWRPGSGEAYF